MIIQSLLDTDLYKFTMMQVVLHHFPAAQVEYRFKCRNEGVDLTPYVDEIRDEVKALCSVRFRKDELDYLRGWRFMKSDFVDLLGLFRLDERFIRSSASIGREIDITIAALAPHHPLRVPMLRSCRRSDRSVIVGSRRGRRRLAEGGEDQLRRSRIPDRRLQPPFPRLAR
jgi:nicotinate phosphoribosyltransferase